MDIVAHGLWSYIIFHAKRYWKWAIFWGVFPDLLGWGPYFVYRLIKGIPLGPPIPALIPHWSWILYGISHSLIIFFIIFAVAFYSLRSRAWPFAAWGVEILMDIPFHRPDYLPTPYLWPLSSVESYAFPSLFGWHSPWFMAVNYAVIILSLLFIAIRKYRKGRL